MSMASVCVASIIRLVVLFDVDPEDLMYSSEIPQLWTAVEVSFAVISSCIPSLTPLFLMLFGKYPPSSHRLEQEHSRQRDYGIRSTAFDRISDLAETHPQSQSLELIIQNRDPTNDSDKINATKGLQESLPGILVTRHVDQVSKDRPGDVSGMEYFGVSAGACTSNH
ncbi:hypothetical protein IMSHALPRED_000275 [Imshaugia aleurites]|uniref:Rhodopsin domain-containing protein n=1 Tax=Imshaugia aleurites TaxID=172621 RepID=A0A8H3F0R6_9LECA|nr:hypothetical protein IMSHALPRED_000275 [Imshaugia aleurites]